MRKTFLTFSLKIACALLVVGSANATELLETGLFHAEEVQVPSKKGWFALFEKSPAKLEEVSINIEAAHDPIVDEANQKTGKLVSIKHKDTPLFLVRSLAGLREGTITIGEASSTDLTVSSESPRKEIRVTFNNETMYLRSEVLEQGYQLSYQRGTVNQILITHDTADDASPKLIWAGDLNHDGHLDFLIDTTRHYNVSRKMLYMSDGTTLRLQGEAEFTTTGC